MINTYCGNHTSGYFTYNAIYNTAGWGDKVLLYAKFGSRSKTKLKGVANTLSLQNITFRYSSNKAISKGFKFKKAFKAVKMDHDWFHTAVVTNELVGSRFLLTSRDFLEEDFYNHLRNNYEVAILKEWTPVIRDRLLDSRLVFCSPNPYAGKVEYKDFSRDEEGTTVTLHGTEVPLKEVLVFDFNPLNQDNYERILMELGDEALIKIADKPSKKLNVTDLNSYIEQFGRKGAMKIKENMNPLVPVESQYKLDSMVMKQSRLFDQQIAAVKGILGGYDIRLALIRVVR